MFLLCMFFVQGEVSFSRHLGRRCCHPVYRRSSTRGAFLCVQLLLHRGATWLFPTENTVKRSREVARGSLRGCAGSVRGAAQRGRTLVTENGEFVMVVQSFSSDLRAKSSGQPGCWAPLAQPPTCGGTLGRAGWLSLREHATPVKAEFIFAVFLLSLLAPNRSSGRNGVGPRTCFASLKKMVMQMNLRIQVKITPQARDRHLAGGCSSLMQPRSERDACTELDGRLWQHALTARCEQSHADLCPLICCWRIHHDTGSTAQTQWRKMSPKIQSLCTWNSGGNAAIAHT